MHITFLLCGGAHGRSLTRASTSRCAYATHVMDIPMYHILCTLLHVIAYYDGVGRRGVLTMDMSGDSSLSLYIMYCKLIYHV
jgi:hypothetical protein